MLFRSHLAAAIDGVRNNGSSSDQGDCLAHALRRHKAGDASSFGPAVINGAQLGSCLRLSRSSESFCAAVPVQSDADAVAAWARGSCARQGLTDVYCSSLMQQVPMYCSAPARAAKIGA